MPLKLSIDFGTATTCMATVADLTDFRADVIPVEGTRPIARTAVFLDRPLGQEPLIRSESAIGRSPMGAFEKAYSQFDAYWSQRREARKDGVTWAEWMQGVPNREEALLLTYFKPELADHPVRVPIRVPRNVWGKFDPITKSDDLEVVFDEREAAIPDPDTEDLVAATAAVLRRCVERAIEQQGIGERIQMLTIGMPSFSEDVPSAERSRAQDRRREAVRLARIAEDYGTSDFHVQLYGEAEAAAWSLDIDSERPTVYKIIVDVGAGTTDLALVEYQRGKKGRYTVSSRIRSQSIRYAGRDLNLALALVLQPNTEFERATKVLDEHDRRAWQYVMDRDVERIKCELSTEEKRFEIAFTRASAQMWGTLEMNKAAHALRCTAFFDLAVGDPRIRAAVAGAAKKLWTTGVTAFIQSALAEVPDRRDFAGVEKVGGAFRFAPLNEQLIAALREADLPAVTAQFRDDNGETQTMVARGLARWSALQE